jgi:hypothetical protein
MEQTFAPFQRIWDFPLVFAFFFYVYIMRRVKAKA